MSIQGGVCSRHGKTMLINTIKCSFMDNYIYRVDLGEIKRFDFVAFKKM